MTERVLYGFQNSPDGASPHGTLLFANGALYGTTNGGGANGYGTVYSIKLPGGASR
jgi:uncharacterized repeat protein (TIGR03803 family)